jgi:hypothetical protein
MTSESRVRMFHRLAAVLLALPLGAFAADPALLQMLMPDAQVVAGLQVDSAKSSLFGQYVLSHLSVNDTKLEQFTSETGFDPRHDVSEIVIGSNWKSNTPDNRWIVAAHGAFNIPKITSTAQANGGVIAPYQGINVVTHLSSSDAQVDTVLAFPDSSTALVGDLASVKAAIDRKKSNTPADAPIVTKAQSVSSGKDFWFVTVVPLSNFSASVPDPNVSGAMKGNLMAAINQTSGGIRFGDTVTISAEAVTRSEKDAQALVDVVKFFAGLVQLNRQKDPTAGQVATLLDALQTSTSGNITSISIAIPEAQLEQLLNSVRPARAKAAARIN